MKSNLFFATVLFCTFFVSISISQAQKNLDYLVNRLKGLPPTEKTEYKINALSAQFTAQTLFFLTKKDSTFGIATGPLPTLQGIYTKELASLPHATVTLFVYGSDTIGLATRNINVSNIRVDVATFMGVDSGQFMILRNPYYTQQPVLPATLFDSITKEVVDGKIAIANALGCFVEENDIKKYVFKGELAYFSGEEMTALFSVLSLKENYFFEDMAMMRVSDDMYESLPDFYGGSVVVSFKNQKVLVGLISNRFQFEYQDPTEGKKKITLAGIQLIDVERLTNKDRRN